MVSMGTQQLKAKSFFIFSLLLTLILFCITTLYNENTNVKLIPQMNYLMVVVALFFLNSVIFLFMLMRYYINKNILPTLILSLAFLSGLFYLIETIVIIHKPINDSTLIQTKSNDISIFYLFRQLSFIFLTALALCCHSSNSILTNNKKKICILLLALIPFMFFPFLAHNLSSYNPNYSLYIADYSPEDNTAAWGINYTKLLVYLWAFLLFFIIMRTRLASELWPSIALLCLASLCCNLLLLALDEYNYSIWYISRGIEVSSKLFVVSFLIYSIFQEIQLSSKLANHDVLTNIYNRRYFFNSVESLLSRPVVKDFCIMLVDINQFRRINAQWGHYVGDKVLVSIVDIIQQSIRPDDIFARLEGNVFGLLFTELNTAQAKIIAERVRKNVELLTSFSNRYDVPEQMSISIGSVFSTGDKRNISLLMTEADKALREAKHNSGNKVIIHQI
ncbi:GGDEF domain-containing protein [Escherichia albertii]|uniref:sensor domain-containing diguanylate cyclase n=1 Tax=Escherichia albertii TaxID=208962 RepID=UPI0012FDF04F|nr:GGDEF domain-containing protein [Escherichia albertii]MCU7275145.1 GGDEF domain-containing protein [Escherichia albertii]MCZ9085595.1 GGDEF domain-containing protein [Escherichia albertii]MDD9751400.1 GGDEF domain-containing protein [Escherichia albertii]QST30248.1 GGDEF domain-containing protein [Escherichia albertii]QST35800.1 GGDEF domain-containing protein [Escherichia albertii]